MIFVCVKDWKNARDSRITASLRDVDVPAGGRHQHMVNHVHGCVDHFGCRFGRTNYLEAIVGVADFNHNQLNTMTQIYIKSFF